jgi:hypothetical protein
MNRWGCGIFALIAIVAGVVVGIQIKKPLSPDEQPTSPTEATSPDPGVDWTRTSSIQLGQECVITISNSLVALMREPNRFSEELIELDPGKYTPTKYISQQSGVGKQGWFLVESEGKRGWVENSTWAIEEKSNACPPHSVNQ